MFASKWISSNLDSIRLQMLRSKYEQVKRTPFIFKSLLGNAYELYVFQSWCGSSNMKLSVITYDENGEAKQEDFKCGTLQKDAPLISTPEQFQQYVNKLFTSNYTKGDVTIIKPTSERFPAIDFGVYDHSEKHLFLVPATIDGTKKLSVSCLEAFDALFNIGVKVELLIVTEREKLREITWKPTTKDIINSISFTFSSIIFILTIPITFPADFLHNHPS